MVTCFESLGHWLEICGPVGKTFMGRAGSLRSGSKPTSAHSKELCGLT